jgi:hypothetical protein
MVDWPDALLFTTNKLFNHNCVIHLVFLLYASCCHMSLSEWLQPKRVYERYSWCLCLRYAIKTQFVYAEYFNVHPEINWKYVLLIV